MKKKIKLLKIETLGKYILDKRGHVIRCDDLIKWSEWFEHSGMKRQLASTTLKQGHVSTIFLSLDHNFGGGKPILWETMVFGSKKFGSNLNRRYYTKAEALKGHKAIVEEIKKSK